MRISTKGRYALRVMIDLAQNDTGDFVALRDISARQEISVKYLEQIVCQLSKAGFLKSARGPQGGYRLARGARTYTAGDILRQTEGSLAPVPCLDSIPPDCARAGSCATLAFWQGLDESVGRYIDGVTLWDLAFPDIDA